MKEVNSKKGLLIATGATIAIVGASGLIAPDDSGKTSNITPNQVETPREVLSDAELKRRRLNLSAQVAVIDLEETPSREAVSKARQAIAVVEDEAFKNQLTARVDTVVKQLDEAEVARAKAEQAEAARRAAAARPAPAPQPQPAPQPAVQCPRNCTEARAMGMRNIPRGHVCYKKHLDRDGDGIGCDK